jgi:hypothetical protein
MRTQRSKGIRHFEGNDYLESTTVTRLHANHTINLRHLRIRVVHVVSSKVSEIICRIYWCLWIVTDGSTMSPRIQEFSSAGTWCQILGNRPNVVVSLNILKRGTLWAYRFKQKDGTYGGNLKLNGLRLHLDFLSSSCIMIHVWNRRVL